MAYLPSLGYSLGTRKLISRPIEVAEPATFKGKWVTVKASIAEVGKYRLEPLRIQRDHPLFATAIEAHNYLLDKNGRVREKLSE